jgi:hypothetical protein
MCEDALYTSSSLLLRRKQCNQLVFKHILFSKDEEEALAQQFGHLFHFPDGTGILELDMPRKFDQSTQALCYRSRLKT